jgi:hypothetical protein
MLCHQLANALLADAYPACNQFLRHARPAIFALDLRVNGLDVREQGIVAYAASVRLVAAGAPLALMISAGVDFQRFTQD